MEIKIIHTKAFSSTCHIENFNYYDSHHVYIAPSSVSSSLYLE